MPRARRAWSTIRDTDIRPLLQETTAASSYWSDADLLLFANLSIDLRAAQMIQEDEGWFTQRQTADIVKDQVEYTVPEGLDNVDRVLYVRTDGGVTREFPLERDALWGEPVAWQTSGSGTVGLPTWRWVGELIYISPPFSENVTNGLVFEEQSLPDRLTGDASKLDLNFPSVMETMLVYDVVARAFDVEDSQGNVDPAFRQRQSGLRAAREEYEKVFQKMIHRRSHGSLMFAQPLYLGD